MKAGFRTIIGRAHLLIYLYNLDVRIQEILNV